MAAQSMYEEKKKNYGSISGEQSFCVKPYAHSIIEMESQYAWDATYSHRTCVLCAIPKGRPPNRTVYVYNIGPFGVCFRRRHRRRHRRIFESNLLHWDTSFFFFLLFHSYLFNALYHPLS